MKKATSLQRSLSSEIESNPIAKLDQFNALPLSFGQGFTTLQSDTQARKPWFFCALPKVYLFGRGGVSSIQDPLWGRLARRSLAVVNTPVVFTDNHFYKTKGEHFHA